MRKGLSSLLLSAILLTMLAPLLALSPQALPACCRAGGRHHCDAMVNLGGEGFRAQMAPCPYRQHPAVTPSHSALHVARAMFAVTRQSDAFTAASHSSIESADRYSLPPRGPPLS